LEKGNKKASSDNKLLLLRAEIETELRTRAYKDEAFQQALKSDLRGVLEREYPYWFPDGKIPQSFTIRIIQEEEDSLNVVLLPKRAGTFTSLTEGGLATVHGGIRSFLPGGAKKALESATTSCNSAVMCNPSVTCVSDRCLTVRC
jgi:hypothetical protein